MPELSVDTKVRGIWIGIYPKCDTLEFVFDLATLEPVNYQEYDHVPGIIHSYEKFFCKTQFSGVKIHILACNIIELTEKYIDYSDIHDEAGFYETKNVQKAAEAFWESFSMSKNLGENLKKWVLR